MSNRSFGALIASCLMLGACGGGSSSPHDAELATSSQTVTGQDGPVIVSAPNTVLNQYGVLAADVAVGATTLTVMAITDFQANAVFPAGLAANDLILVYQPMGASISVGNNATFGAVGQLQGAGNYELVHVAAVAGNTITIESTCGGLEHAYTMAGRTQVIRVPQAASLAFTGATASLTADNWDGTTGGVVAIHVQGAVTIGGAGITASGRGFRGGAIDNGAATGSNVFVTLDDNLGAEKGESIAGDQATYDSTFGGRNGRGAPANGGGGGNADAAAGGGGANGNNGNVYNGHGVMDATVTGAAAWSRDPGFAIASANTNSSGGGRGGYSRSDVDLNPINVDPGDPTWGADEREEVGGRGGHPLINDPTTRLFMGGGGGAGATTTVLGGAGGRGGGLVLLIADTVSGGRIQANGVAGDLGAGDGPGGGGGGGAIVVKARTITGTQLNADGGIGGDHSSLLSASGGGGGGGGGFVAISTGTPTPTAAGAASGTTDNTAVSEFPVNGGTKGALGQATATITTLPVCTGVDLSITKTNGVASSTPGTATTYTIVATNNGADVVANAIVADTFVAALTGVSWACVASIGSICPPNSTGNLNNPITLQPGGTATFTVTATISPAATGTLSNTATITAPADIVDPNAGNNSATDTDTLTPSADLAITVTGTPDLVIAGANITYTINASNAGPSNAASLTMTDVLPADTTFVSASGSGWSCSETAGTVTCTRGTLTIAAAPSIALVVTAPDDAGTVSNTVTIAATTTDPVAGNNTASTTTTVQARADLAVTVSDNPDPVSAGGTLTYTVSVNNLGPSAATNVTVTDTIAATTTFVSAIGTGWACTQAGVVVTCTRASLAAGAAPSIAVVVTAPVQGGSITNTAAVSTTTIDPVAGNNSQTIATTVTARADLSITKTDSPDPVTAGGQLQYAIVVSNAGPSNAATLSMTDPLPPGTTFVSAVGTGWSCAQAAGTVTCTRAALNTGITAPTITITVNAPTTGGTISNTASITAATSDPNTGNNSATATTDVTASADLAITVVDSPDPVIAGATLTYTVSATNLGPSTAADVTVVDTLPAGTTFIDVNATGWTCSETAGSVTCTRTTLATTVNQPIVIRVTAPTAGGVITNNATVASATTTDPNVTNNAVNTNTTVNARADLSITKIDEPDPVATGATLTYTIAVTNAGPSDAANLIMVDTLPAGVTFVSADGTGWSCTQVGVTVTCTRASLGVAAAPLITIVVTAPLTNGTISNTATVSSATTDPNTASNSDTEQTTVTPTTDLAMVATSSAATIEAGNTLTFTVDITNGGPITATGVVIGTTLPTGLTFTSGAGTGWTCAAAAQVVTCTRASLAVGVAPTVTIDVATDAPSGTTVTTVLAVSSNFADPTPGNDSVSFDTLIIDREIDVVAIMVFPDTFRNPGAAAPVRPVTVTNSGDAVLRLTSVVLATSDPAVWTLVDGTPQDLPAGASFDYLLRFSPTTLGAAPDATITITSDDRSEPTTVLTVTGTAIDRNVGFALPRIDLGFTGLGVPVTIGDAVQVASLNTTTTFAITRIDIVDDAACETGEASSNAGVFTLIDGPVGTELPPTQQATFDVRFSSSAAGRFAAGAQLFIEPDPVPQAAVCLEGEAVFVDARGGGGCSTGGDVGGGALIWLAAIGIVLRRRRRALIAATIALTAVPASADKLAISIFDPTPATTGTNFQLQSADVGHTGDFVLTATFSHATDPLVLDGGVDGQAQVIQRSTLMMLGGAFAFADRFEAGARIPLYLQDGAAAGDRTMMFTADPASGAAMGDITMHGKVRLWKRGGAAVGAAVQLTIPTAPIDSFTGTEKPSLRAIALASLAPDAFEHRLSLTSHFGGVARTKSEFANIEQGSGVTWGLGASVRALDRMWFSAEVFGDLLPSARKATATTGAVSLSPIEWLAGLRYAPDHRFSVGLAFGRGLTAAAGSPSLRGVLELTYAPRAAELRPIRVAVQPRPDLDADHDGFRDSIDKCPTDPEDVDMFDDSDGCPDLDNDKDGVPDAADRCPLDPEDVDKFDDQDGCPDKDNDADGIADVADKCPMEPEDKDGFSDVDGCPDPDNDNDGVPDVKDKCPAAAETINGNKDDDGCPDPGDSTIVLSPDRIETLDAVQFDRGNKIAKASFIVLGQVGATMRAHPEIIRMRVTVHVHPTGNFDKDQELSEKRAQLIRDWLVQWGLTASRVEARGFGSSKPLAPQDQKGAKDINDRVELIILERR